MASLEDCHQKALDRLCRICAGLLKRDSSKKLEVKKHQENLKAAFWIENIEQHHSEIHPKLFCKTCYYTMINIVKKNRTHNRTEVFYWEPHNENCRTCVIFTEKGKGGRSKKIPRSGVKLTNPEIDAWTKAVTESLKENVPPQRADVSNLNTSDFDIADNPSLDLCKCYICDKIMKRPVMIESCQHAFCLGCLVLKFEGKIELECPYCFVAFKLNFKVFVVKRGESSSRT